MLTKSAVERFLHSSQDSKRMMLIIINTEPEAIVHAPLVLRDDEDVVIRAVTANGQLLKYASNRLKCNKKIVKLSMLQYAGNCQYADGTLHGKIYDTAYRMGMNYLTAIQLLIDYDEHVKIWKCSALQNVCIRFI